jgi:hypothetical protein
LCLFFQTSTCSLVILLLQVKERMVSAMAKLRH